MLAIVGFILTQYVHLPGDQFQVGPLEALTSVSVGAQAQVFSCEFSPRVGGGEHVCAADGALEGGGWRKRGGGGAGGFVGGDTGRFLGRFHGDGGGVYAFIACLVIWTIDPAPLST